MASYNKSLRAHKQRRYTMEAAYLVYSSYIAALGEKLRRAQQGMLPCQALRSFSFLPFNPREYPTRTVWHSIQKKSMFLAIVLITEVFTSLSECGMVKASTYAR